MPWGRLLFAVLLAVPFFWRLDAEEFHGDESHWISSGQEGFYLLTSGRLDDPEWREQFYFYSQPQVGKLLIGAALAAAGYAGHTQVYDYDWQLKPDENRAAGRVPAPGAVLAGRVPGALAGWAACLLVWLLCVTLGAPRAGPLAALLLASHPLWLANARRAGLDATSLCFGLAATLCVLRANRARTRPRAVALWICGGVYLGLAAADKYVGLLPLGLAAIDVLAQLSSPTRRPLTRATRLPRWGRELTVGVPPQPRVTDSSPLRGEAGRGALLLTTFEGATAALVVATAIFWISNPTLYQRPLYQVEVSVDFLSTQARDMRRDAPAFESPLFVAVEMVDRAIWPTGRPVIVDHTLPEPLSPGSYGTPAVALGVLLALAALATDKVRRPLAVAAGGTVVVYVLLALSIPIWWERWHLPLIPPLCILAAMGLAWLAGYAPYPAAAAPAAAQMAATLAMEPSFLGRGFGALALRPFGLTVHVAALAWVLAPLVSQAWKARYRNAAPLRTEGVTHGSTTSES